ncbi:MAG: hypothetical protein ACRD3L_09265 [Terriglobales bacterium]
MMQASIQRRNLSPPAFQYVCLALLFAGSMLFQIRYGRDIWRGEKVDFPFVIPATASPSLEVVLPSAAQLGLRKGDVLLAVNGKKYTGTAQLAEAYGKARPGDHIEITVQSSSGVHSVNLDATAMHNTWVRVLYDMLLDIAAPIGCILLGSWVVLVRPRDRLAWILFGLLLCFSQMFSSFKIESWGPGYREIAMAYRSMLNAAWPIFMFLFGFYFPEPFPSYTRLGKGRWWIPALVIAPILLNIAFSVAIATTEMTNFARAHQFYKIFLPLQNPMRLYLYCVVGFGFFTSIFIKSSVAVSADAKRRLRLLYWGATTALLPLFLMTVAQLIGGKSLFDLFPDWLIGIGLGLTTLFPLTLAYVIVV